MVDLPGLIHSESKSQSKDDVQLIRSLVEEYISNERTIILAVVSAKNDYANQIILKDCRRVDGKGSRTLGLITKPDFLRPGSENEKDWIDLAQNRDIYFELGWHMLKNRSDDERNTSFSQRNESESLFFSRGKYRDLPQQMFGIEALRTRLSRLLNQHLRRELPELQQELNQKYQEAATDLAKLGEKRATVMEQRIFLTGISTSVHRVLTAAVKGQYEDPFFDPVDTTAGIAASTNRPRLRAVVQHLNLEFAKHMRLKGHKYDLTVDSVPPPVPRKGDHEDELTEPMDDAVAVETQVAAYDDPQESARIQTFFPLRKVSTHTPNLLTRSEALQWVLQVLKRSRGRELPGNFNPMLISQLFWDQSEKWEDLALKHIMMVASVCEDTVNFVLRKCASSDIVARLSSLKVECALKNRVDASIQELHRIIEDKKRHPITYNHYYTTTIQKIKSKKYNAAVTRATDAAKVNVYEKTHAAGPGYREVEYINPSMFQASLDKSFEQDMDRYSAEEAFDCQIAYYKASRAAQRWKYFLLSQTPSALSSLLEFLFLLLKLRCTFSLPTCSN